MSSQARQKQTILDESQAVSWMAKNIGIDRSRAARLLRAGMGEGVPAPGKLSFRPRLYLEESLVAWLNENAERVCKSQFFHLW